MSGRRPYRARAVSADPFSSASSDGIDQRRISLSNEALIKASSCPGGNEPANSPWGLIRRILDRWLMIRSLSCSPVPRSNEILKRLAKASMEDLDPVIARKSR